MDYYDLLLQDDTSGCVDVFCGEFCGLRYSVTIIFEHNSNGGKQNHKDHMITIPMAKELCMIQRTDIGRQFRQYFISIEEAWNSPEMVMQRALAIANERVKTLQLSVPQLTVDNQIMKPNQTYDSS